MGDRRRRAGRPLPSSAPGAAAPRGSVVRVRSRTTAMCRPGRTSAVATNSIWREPPSGRRKLTFASHVRRARSPATSQARPLRRADPRRAASSLLVRDAEQLSGRLVQIDESAFVVGHEHRHHGVLERRCEEQVRLALGGDVLDVGDRHRRRAVVPAHERDRQVSPQYGSVLTHVALLALIRVALAGPNSSIDCRSMAMSSVASRHAR